MIFENYASVLYAAGLVLVALYLLMGIDDFVWDILTLFLRPTYRKQKLNFQRLNSVPPKLLAVAIAAWREDNVLGDVIDNIIASADYPRSMYHIFLGVYPNDPATIQVANALSERYANVHVIVNSLPGPTSKAQNLNHVIRRIRDFEQAHGWVFASLTIHDSEDVIHPSEFQVTNYLIETHDALQFPVFPLMKMPRFSNFFKTITTGTYADEFAENHYTTMVNRYMAGAFVPSAGTGFTLSRKTLNGFGDGDVLPSDSLTEDYRLSLTLFQRGIRLYYVLERVPRVNRRGKIGWDYITTRSLFPNTFKTAVKQKTRWILGITMQSFRFRDIVHIKGLSFAGRYSLYKDQKAKVGNLLAMVGYPVLIYFGVSLFLPLTPIYPWGSLSWVLSLIVTVMMLERQLFRSVSIFHVYGMRSVFFACLFPPILPIRLIWGNIINMVATLRAYRQNALNRRRGQATPTPANAGQTSEASAVKRAPIVWAKTDHVFLEKTTLQRYRRTIGDLLLEQGAITPKAFQAALKNASGGNQMIGTYLVSQRLVGEDQVLDALARVKHTRHLTPSSLESYDLQKFAGQFDEALLRRLLALPLLATDHGFVIAFCLDSPMDAQATLRKACGVAIKTAHLDQPSILRGLDILYGHAPAPALPTSPLDDLYKAGSISDEQLILARNYASLKAMPENWILAMMGLLPETAVPGAEHAAATPHPGALAAT